jgi:putative membrane protein
VTELDRATDLAIRRTELAVERTVMASERTLMAWGRTGLSQIGLGLSLYKFLEALDVKGFGLPLLVIAVGTFGAGLGIFDYLTTITRLNKRYDAHFPRMQYKLVLSAIIALFGLSVLVTLLVEREGL